MDQPYSIPQYDLQHRLFGTLPLPNDQLVKMFGRITQLAKRYFAVPFAMISFTDAKSDYSTHNYQVGVHDPVPDLALFRHILEQDEPVFIEEFIEDLPADGQFISAPLGSASFVTNPSFIKCFAGVPIHMPDGEAVGILCVFDHYARKFTSEDRSALQEFATLVEDEVALIHRVREPQNTVQVYTTVLRSLPIGLIVGYFEDLTDPFSLHVVDANLALSATINLDLAELINRRLIDALPNLIHTRVFELALETAQLGAPREVGELKYSDKRIPLGYFNVATFPLPNQHVCISFANLTDEKMTETQLALSVSMLNATLEASGSGILAIHGDLNTIVNQKFLELWNVLDTMRKPSSLAQMRQLQVHMISQVKNPDVFFERSQAINQRPDMEVYDEIELRDGRILERTSLPQRIGDQIVGRVWAYRDITERKRTEQYVADQFEALTKANVELEIARRAADDTTRMKSEFLATMSHELRTPLNAIIGYNDLMLAGIAGKISKDQRNYLQRALANSENLLTLINDILDISKIEAGRVELKHKPFAPQKLVDDLLLQMAGLAEHKKINLTATVTSSMPTTLIGDYNRIKQVLLNLVGNAIKFTDVGDVKVLIQAADENHWEMVVADTGIGIAKEMHDKIYDEFRQIDSTSTRRQGGAGLGLAIVRKLLTLMNGSITLESELGKGSTFTVKLPTA